MRSLPAIISGSSLAYEFPIRHVVERRGGGSMPQFFAELSTHVCSGRLRFISVKEQVLQATSRLPDDIDYRDVTDEIAFLAAMREAEQDIQNDRLVTNEQMKTRLGQWTGK